jgi:SAM-dependent methyltransferase
MNDTDRWIIACPVCRHRIGPLPAAGRVECSICRRSYQATDGIWDFLPPERDRFFGPFLRDYTLIRHAEGRGSSDPHYYLQLPACDARYPIARQWALRIRTFHFLRRHILPGLGSHLAVLDLGAGVGWLSHRLGTLGCRPCAVDLNIDARDGLGAARHYPQDWPRLRAEFDRLPIAASAADLVIYNASFHYSTDYRATLEEALRVLRPGGVIVVLETPVYRRDESGRQMVAERHAAFEQRYGTRSDSLECRQYLTWGGIEQLADQLALQCKTYKPWYGFRWASRPWLAKLRNRRAPSEMPVLVIHPIRARDPGGGPQHGFPPATQPARGSKPA